MPSKTKQKNAPSKSIAKMLDENYAQELVMRLMAVRGTSGDEAGVADLVRGELQEVGVKASAFTVDNAHHRTPIRGEVGNVAYAIPGTFRGPRRLLMAHMDTVPICIGSRPVRRGQMVYSANLQSGLGADDRAGVAVTLFVARELKRLAVPHPPLTFLWTIQEENGLHGVRYVRRGMLGKPSLAFNWDGGAANKLTVGATGGYRMQINVRGLASHAGGAPEKGVSAIAIASVAIADLHRNGWHGLIRKNRKTGTSNVGVLRGGDATDHVVVKAEARSHDPKFRQKIVHEIQQAFRRAVQLVKNDHGKTGKVSFAGQLDYEAFCLPRKEPCVQVAASAIRSLGQEPELAIANGGLDANWMVAHGIPTVTLGCGQLNQHTVNESLDLKMFANACRVAWRLATATENHADAT